MKSNMKSVLSFIVCLLITAEIFVSVPASAYYSGQTGPGDSSGDIVLPIDPFHVLTCVPAKPATCTESGNKEYYICSECGKWFEDSLGKVEITDKSSVLIPAAGHTPAAAVTENVKEATCDTEGSYDLVVYCAVCGEELSREKKTVPATGHSFGDPVFEWEEDCSGAKASFTCSACGHVEVIEANITSEAVTKHNGLACSGAVYTATAALGEKTYTDSKTVIEFYYGDANGDNKVDAKDIVRVRKYLDNLDEATGYSSIEVSFGADVNGNKKIDSKDLIRLRKYLDSLDEVTGYSPIELGPGNT